MTVSRRRFLRWATAISAITVGEVSSARLPPRLGAADGLDLASAAALEARG
ncbi:MAG: hypothetical protein HY048_18090 [Acidobacteria bacterium]|nr:hypothetical protein [Acidobacteriota bacterium]